MSTAALVIGAEARKQPNVHQLMKAQVRWESAARQTATQPEKETQYRPTPRHGRALKMFKLTSSQPRRATRYTVLLTGNSQNMHFYTDSKASGCLVGRGMGGRALTGTGLLAGTQRARVGQLWRRLPDCWEAPQATGLYASNG